jgi:hypothetical protein
MVNDFGDKRWSLAEIDMINIVFQRVIYDCY